MNALDLGQQGQQLGLLVGAQATAVGALGFEVSQAGLVLVGGRLVAALEVPLGLVARVGGAVGRGEQQARREGGRAGEQARLCS